MTPASVLLLTLLLPADGGVDTYRILVDEAIVFGRAGSTEEARSTLGRAIALAPDRPEAWAEMGGAWFVDGQYDRAIADLERAMELHGDDWTRELLASAYLLVGRTDDALRSWNQLGGPVLRKVRIEGGSKGLEAIVRREVPCEEGRPLRLDDVRASRLRLHDVPVLERATLRPVMVEEGSVDLVVFVSERRGLGGSPVGFVMSTLPPLAFQTLRLEVANVAGTGLNVGGSYRFEKNRPEVRLGVEVARPLGLPALLSVSGWRGQQTYTAQGPSASWESMGGALSLRRSLGARTRGRLGVRFEDRWERSASGPGATSGALPPLGGRLVVAELGLERRLVDTWRFDLDAGMRLSRSDVSLGSAADYWRGTATLAATVHLRAAEESPIEPNDIGIRLRGGWAGAGVPLDEAFHPGSGEEADFALRARQRMPDGVVLLPAASRNLQVLNVEWRARLVKSTSLSVGAVAFVDFGRTWNWSGQLEGVVDAGVGVRIAAREGPVLRIDWGHGLVDGSSALTFGLRQAF